LTETRPARVRNPATGDTLAGWAASRPGTGWTADCWNQENPNREVRKRLRSTVGENVAVIEDGGVIRVNVETFNRNHCEVVAGAQTNGGLYSPTSSGGPLGRLTVKIRDR
jgi:hypothetical protein